jgi:hypothetical protein
MSGVRDIIHPSRQPMPSHFNSSLRKTIGEDGAAVSAPVVAPQREASDSGGKPGLRNPN